MRNFAARPDTLLTTESKRAAGGHGACRKVGGMEKVDVAVGPLSNAQASGGS